MAIDEPLRWRRPKECDTNTCPEVLTASNGTFVRSSTNPQAVTYFTPDEWAALVHAIRKGEFSGSE